MLKLEFIKRKVEHRKLLKELKQKGLTIEEKSYRPEEIEGIVKKFMGSIGYTIEDFPEILKLMGITVPVKISSFACSHERVKFTELTTGRTGDLHLISAEKDEAEDYEVKPEIRYHSQHKGLTDIRYYEVKQNESDFNKLLVLKS